MSLDISLFVSPIDDLAAGRIVAESIDLNITHNLSRMAAAAGVRDPIWDPIRHFRRDLTDDEKVALDILIDPEVIGEGSRVVLAALVPSEGRRDYLAVLAKQLGDLGAVAQDDAEAALSLAAHLPVVDAPIRAYELVDSLRAGLLQLKQDPARFRLLNPPNGWGSYEVLVRFVEEYLAACEANPGAYVNVSR